MRHDMDWVQRTHDTLEHLHENIAQPIIFRGMILKTRCGESLYCHPSRQ
jgi:hypothetical protein